MTGTPHEIVEPPDLPTPVGFAHAVASAPGRMVHVAGQVGEGPDGYPDELAAQFDLAAANVVAALRAAGAEPEHIVSMQIFTTDVDAYRAASRRVGEAYRRHFGGHYPAMALIGVSRLFDPEAAVEVVCTAVVPEDGEESNG